MNISIGRQISFKRESMIPFEITDHIVVLLEILLATTLTLFLLGEKSLWLDEGFTIIYTRDWVNIWASMFVTGRSNMWLYYTLLHFWIEIGESEFFFRSLSAFFAIGTIPVVYNLGKQLFSSRVGLIAGLLLAINAFYIQYAQEARSYSLLIFLTALSSYFFVKSVEQPTLKSLSGYIISIVLSMLAHYFGVLVLITHFSSLIFRGRNIPWKKLIFSGVAATVLILPLFVFLFPYLTVQSWAPIPDLVDVYRLFSKLAGKSPKLVWIYFILSSIAFVFAVIKFVRIQSLLKIWPYFFLITSLLVPVIITFVVSVVLRSVFIPRYLIICLPAFVLLVAVGISKISNEWVHLAVLALILFVSSRSLVRWYFDHPKENWRDATALVLTEAQPGDAVYFFQPTVRVPFEYYLSRSNVLDDFITLVEPDPDLVLLEGLSAEYSRIWLVLSHDQNLGRDEKNRFIQSSLSREHFVTIQEEFTGIRVILYERLPLKTKR